MEKHFKSFHEDFQYFEEEDAEILFQKFFISTNQPFSIVKNEYLQELLKKLKIGSSATKLKTDLELLYNKGKLKIKDLLKDKFNLCFSMDLWTACNGNEFLSVFCTFLDDNFEIQPIMLGLKLMNFLKIDHEAISLVFSDILIEYGINENQIYCITTDRGSNIMKYVNEMAENKNIKVIYCYCHLLSNCLGNAIKKCYPDLLNKINSISTNFKRSRKLKQYLIQQQQLIFIQKSQQQLSQVQNQLVRNEPLKFVYHEPTRWCSFQKCIERMLILKDSINTCLLYSKDVLKHKNNVDIILNEEDWKNLVYLNDLFSMFSEASTKMESESYATISSSVYYMYAIKFYLEKENTEIAKNMNNYLVENFFFIQEHYFSLLLDPNYKDFKFAGEMKNDIIRQIKVLPNNQSIQQKKFNLNPFQVCNIDGNEIERYLKFNIFQEIDVLEFWKKNKLIFPNLSKIAQKIFSIPASSAPCERINKAAKIITSEKRSNLLPKNSEMLTFLKKNFFYIDFK